MTGQEAIEVLKAKSDGEWFVKYCPDYGQAIDWEGVKQWMGRIKRISKGNASRPGT